MEYGVARSIATKQLSGEYVDESINIWLRNNPDVEIIDIQFTANATQDDWNSEVLIIYRKNY